MRTIVKLNESVEENASHGDGVAREVGVVVHAFADLKAGRRVGVTGQQGEDVVLSRNTSLAPNTPALYRDYSQHHHGEP